MDSRAYLWLPRIGFGVSVGSAIATGLYLVTWPRRCRRLGKPLLPLRRLPNSKLYMGIGGLFWLASGLQVVSLVAQLAYGAASWTPQLQLTVSQILCFGTAGSLIVAGHQKPPEIRERGICHQLSAIPWQQVAAYSWDARQTKIVFWLQPRKFVGRRSYEAYVPSREVDIVEDILAQHVPKRPNQ